MILAQIGYGAFKCPAQGIHAPTQSGVRNTRRVSDILETTGCLFKAIKRGVRSVSALNASGGPYAIFLRVRAVIIDAFYGVSGARFRPHVFNKSIEIPPLLADINPPPSVSRVGLVLGVAAALPHAEPCSVARVRGAQVFRSKFSGTPNHASATRTTPINKVSGVGPAFISAIAKTFNQPIYEGRVYHGKHPVTGGEGKWFSHVRQYGSNRIDVSNKLALEL